MALKGSTIITQNVCFVLEKHITPLDCLEPRSTPTANCSAGDEAVMARGACLSLLVSVASIVALVIHRNIATLPTLHDPHGVRLYSQATGDGTSAMPGARELGEAAVAAGWKNLSLIKFHIIGDGHWYLHPDVAAQLGWHTSADAPPRVHIMSTPAVDTPHLKWAVAHYGDGVITSPEDVLLFVDNSAWLYWHEVVLVTATHVAHATHVCGGGHGWATALADVRGVLPRHPSYQCRRLDAPFGVRAPRRHFCGSDVGKNPPGSGNATWSVLPVMCSPSVEAIASLLHEYLPRARAHAAVAHAVAEAGVAAALDHMDSGTSDSGSDSDSGNGAAARSCGAAVSSARLLWAGLPGYVSEGDAGARSGAGAGVLRGNHSTMSAFAYPIAQGGFGGSGGFGAGGLPQPLRERTSRRLSTALATRLDGDMGDDGDGEGELDMGQGLGSDQDALGPRPSVLDVEDRPLRLLARRARVLWHATLAAAVGSPCAGALSAVAGECGLAKDAVASTTPHPTLPRRFTDDVQAWTALMVAADAPRTFREAIQASIAAGETDVVPWFRLFQTRVSGCTMRDLRLGMVEALFNHVAVPLRVAPEELVAASCLRGQAQRAMVVLAAGFEAVVASGVCVEDLPAVEGATASDASDGDSDSDNRDGHQQDDSSSQQPPQAAAAASNNAGGDAGVVDGVQPPATSGRPRGGRGRRRRVEDDGDDDDEFENIPQHAQEL